MIKRAVIRVAARGYVDGRYIGEEREEIEAIDPSGRGKRRRKGQRADIDGNRTKNKDGTRKRRGKTPRPVGQGKNRPSGKPTRGGIEPGNALGQGADSGPNGKTRKNRGGRNTPFRRSARVQPSNESGGLLSDRVDPRRSMGESKTGQFAEALQREAHIKRERLHKVLAQSGLGSRRDMEIMITSGRVMVNGIVATIGMSVSPHDNVSVDHRPVKLKFGEDLPRVLLYHKPDGEIVTTNDPGNRITVFDNLPRVENGKWIAVGRLDINTSGLLIFTTSGELANRLMHPRYEVEREYAVRILGELSEEQTSTLLSGVNIDADAPGDDDLDDPDNEAPPDDRPAKFESLEKRGGNGANQWYHVVIKEGRNREVRRMFEAVGLTVSRLLRVRFGKIALPPRLLRGRMLELNPGQVRAVLQWVGMEADGPISPLPSPDASPGVPYGEANADGRSKGTAQNRRQSRYKPRRQEANDGNASSVEMTDENLGNRADGEPPIPTAERVRNFRRRRSLRIRNRAEPGNAPQTGAAGEFTPDSGDNTVAATTADPAERRPGEGRPNLWRRGRRRFRAKRKPSGEAN